MGHSPGFRVFQFRESSEIACQRYFCFGGRIDTDRLEQLRRAGAITVNMGDYILIWIDSFGSNTTQDGYETLCVEEASLRKLKTALSVGSGSRLRV
jgi:hypothetical protein